MYEIGDKVMVYFQGEKKEAEIIEVDKIFRETNKEGEFVEQGLFLRERQIATIPLPYEYHGDVLIVNYPESKIAENNDNNSVTYRCRDHAFTLRIDENLVVVEEDFFEKYGITT